MIIIDFIMLRLVQHLLAKESSGLSQPQEIKCFARRLDYHACVCQQFGEMKVSEPNLHAMITRFLLLT